MTGTERLRELSSAILDSKNDGGNLSDLLYDIAAQITCELREERDRWDNELCEAQMDKTRVMAVYLEMKKHVLGHEGAEDSPVARWARELRDAIKSDASDAAEAQNPSCADPDGAADVTSEAQKVTRDPAEDVSMSAYDLLPADERDAIAWVREHGGIESVKAQRRESMPRAAYERKKAGFLDHIAECETALGRRREIISKLGHRVSDLTRENAELRRRAMPEGCQWPRYESGEPVGFGDEVSRLGEVWRICLYRDGSFSLNFRSYSKGERVNRPAPKVLDADGVDTSVGDTVYDVDTGEKMWVYALPEQGAYQCVKLRLINGMFKTLDPCRLTHRAPVLAGDGKPLRGGETAWGTKGGSYHLTSVHDGKVFARHVGGSFGAEVESAGGEGLYRLRADRLTHERLDSWERLEEDAAKNYVDYWGCGGFLCSECPAVVDGKRPWERFGCGDYPEASKNCTVAKARDIVRRAKALTEKENRNE